MQQRSWGFSALVVFIASFALISFSGCGHSNPPPSITNINNSTTPSSPVGLAIEVNGTNFLNSPGKVVFTQGNASATVTPNASGWSDNSIVVVVPAANFTLPGTVTVTVVTAGGTSNKCS